MKWQLNKSSSFYSWLNSFTAVCHPEERRISGCFISVLPTIIPTLSFVYLRVDSNQNNETGKPATDDVAANEQNILPADTPPPASLENQPPPPEITPPQTQPPMEVHHHAHTPRKKWNHYLWEFIMLFLAVFCGFLAENFREHQVEHQREKQFIRSLYNDIKADTANLDRIIIARTLKGKALDSLSYLMNTTSPESFSREIYFFAAPIARTLPYRFVPNDGTLQQLKNSGGLRLIRKSEVVDSIAKYDVNVRNMVGQGAVEESIIESYRTAATRMFDALVFEQMQDKNLNIFRLPEGKYPLQPYNKRELFEWNYRVYGLKAINKANRRDERSLLRQSINLLNTLEKAYHLQ
jgi:hypothetical protein